ncbi:hypothetical protein BJ322DRAFT_1026133 [Thelephora terrestris]|uniref:Uncharacterized protein n=1 Tax=Thelephora terrestris TaxID=56493 RepID=A0A9P6HNP4_9AGAM|nr:hypothetical protein BJ322DRAFT_1026133 [Thelephora terrestris]
MVELTMNNQSPQTLRAPRPIPYTPRPLIPYRGRQPHGHSSHYRGRGRERFGRARPTRSYSKCFTKAPEEDIMMKILPTINDNVLSDFFCMGTDSEAGPSSMVITTPTLISTSAVEIFPEVIAGQLASELASGISNIDIESVCTEEVVVSGKGKGVDHNTGPE